MVGSETQIAVVTGATSGIGLVTATRLVEQGLHVIALGRNPEKIAATDKLIQTANPGARLDWVQADFASLAQTTKASRQILGMVDRIDVLVNNAGNHLDGHFVTDDGFETTYQVNHLAPFLMTAQLIDHLMRADAPRVITLSSIGHSMIEDMVWDDLQLASGEFLAFKAYAQSKLANLLFTRELARRHAGSKLVASAVHPGLVASDFPNKGDAYMRDYYRDALENGEAFTSEQGADTVIWLALDAEVGVPSGGYFYLRERVDSSAAGANPESAARLWKISEEQVAAYL